MVTFGVARFGELALLPALVQRKHWRGTVHP